MKSIEMVTFEKGLPKSKFAKVDPCAPEKEACDVTALSIVCLINEIISDYLQDLKALGGRI